MIPEERAYFARVTAANAEAVKAERQKIEDARKREQEKFVKFLLKDTDRTMQQIADIAEVSVDLVLEVQQRHSADK
ncbi:hypothetical protein [Spirosoma aerophilum]